MVTIVLCTVTYGIVFNFAAIKALAHQWTQPGAARAQRGMLGEPSEAWQDRARRLQQREANDETRPPASRWLYLWYVVRWVIGRRKRKREEELEVDDRGPEDVSERGEVPKLQRRNCQTF